MINLWIYNITRGLKPYSAVPANYKKGVKDGLKQGVKDGIYASEQYEEWIGEPYKA